jgi:hypothetical protein
MLASFKLNLPSRFNLLQQLIVELARVKLVASAVHQITKPSPQRMPSVEISKARVQIQENGLDCS